MASKECQKREEYLVCARMEQRLLTLNAKDVVNVPNYNQVTLALLDEVTDGDTLKIIIPLSEERFLKLGIRVAGIDAPETTLKGTTTPLQKEAGILVKKYVEQLFLGKKIIHVTLTHSDKWGGRQVGEVFLNYPSEETLSTHLIKKGYVKPYDGKRKEEWTAEQLMAIIGKAEREVGSTQQATINKGKKEVPTEINKGRKGKK